MNCLAYALDKWHADGGALILAVGACGWAIARLWRST